MFALFHPGVSSGPRHLTEADTLDFQNFTPFTPEPFIPYYFIATLSAYVYNSNLKIMMNDHVIPFLRRSSVAI